MNYQMDEMEFQLLVEEALDELPEKFKKKMENIEVMIEDWPSPDVLSERGLYSPYQLLGIYRGVPLPKRTLTSYGNVLPDQIVIYQKPIEFHCGSYVEMKEKVKEVVLHEIGHYFGLSEEELRE